MTDKGRIWDTYNTQKSGICKLWLRISKTYTELRIPDRQRGNFIRDSDDVPLTSLRPNQRLNGPVPLWRVSYLISEPISYKIHIQKPSPCSVIAKSWIISWKPEIFLQEIHIFRPQKRSLGKLRICKFYHCIRCISKLAKFSPYLWKRMYCRMQITCFEYPTSNQFQRKTVGKFSLNPVRKSDDNPIKTFDKS